MSQCPFQQFRSVDTALLCFRTEIKLGSFWILPKLFKVFRMSPLICEGTPRWDALAGHPGLSWLSLRCVSTWKISQKIWLRPSEKLHQRQTSHFHLSQWATSLTIAVRLPVSPRATLIRSLLLCIGLQIRSGEWQTDDLLMDLQSCWLVTGGGGRVGGLCRHWSVRWCRHNQQQRCHRSAREETQIWVLKEATDPNLILHLKGFDFVNPLVTRGEFTPALFSPL